MNTLEIKGYKSIKFVRIKLTNINILIGGNGVGKSNFISFFKFLNQVYEQSLGKYVAQNGGINKFLFMGRKVTKELSWYLDFGNNQYGCTLIIGQDDFIFGEERLGYLNSFLGIANFKKEASIKDHDYKGNSTNRSKWIRSALTSYKVYHFHDTGKNSDFNARPIINDYVSFGATGHNIAAMLYHYARKNSIIYKRIVAVFKSVVPYFRDFEFIIEDDKYVQMGWYREDSDLLFSISDFSDGSIRFLALCVLFLQPNPPSTIIIDEPELGLHPFAITKLAGMIQSVAAKNIQVIAATQSSDFVNHFDPNDIITVDQVNGESTFNRLDENKLAIWLENYTIGDLWQKNMIGGQP